MKTTFGILLIILAIIVLARYPNLGVSFPETLGALISISILVVPGILLIRSDIRKSNNKST